MQMEEMEMKIKIKKEKKDRRVKRRKECTHQRHKRIYLLYIYGYCKRKGKTRENIEKMMRCNGDECMSTPLHSIFCFFFFILICSKINYFVIKTAQKHKILYI